MVREFLLGAGIGAGLTGMTLWRWLAAARKYVEAGRTYHRAAEGVLAVAERVSAQAGNLLTRAEEWQR